MELGWSREQKPRPLGDEAYLFCFGSPKIPLILRGTPEGPTLWTPESLRGRNWFWSIDVTVGEVPGSSPAAPFGGPPSEPPMRDGSYAASHPLNLRHMRRLCAGLAEIIWRTGRALGWEWGSM